MAEPSSNAPSTLQRIQAQMQAEMQTLTDEDAIAEQEPRLTWAHKFVHFWMLVGRNFLRNRCPVRASALAYTTLLALVPLLAVSISVATLFLPRDEAKQKEQLIALIDVGIAHAAPTLGIADDKNTSEEAKAAKKRRDDVAGTIVGFVGNIRFGTIGATAMAGLLFVAISLMRTVESAFNDIWGVAKGRTWFMSIVLYWAVITLGPVVVVLAKSANYLSYLQSFQSEHLSENWMQKTFIGKMLTSFSWVFPLGLMGAAFAALYLWMPNTRVRWQAALIGGLVAAALWTLNGRLAAIYNARVVTYSAIYGSLGIVPLFLAGMYFSWLILLFGSQTAYVFQHRHAYLQERRAGRVHQQGREFIALRLMTHLGERFLQGERPATASRLADRFGIPPKLTQEILQSLVAAGLVVEASGAETAYAPGRPLDLISARDVLRALRSGQGHYLPTNMDSARPLVRQEFEGILAAEDARAGGVTIEDLAKHALSSTPPPGPA